MPSTRGVTQSDQGRGVSSAHLHPGNAALRRAIQENIVCFPSQVPVLSRQARPDIQWRVVTLYLVLGWTMNDIGARFGLALSRISLMIHDWAVRAFALGYIQVLDPDRFALLCGAELCDEPPSRPEISLVEPGVSSSLNPVAAATPQDNVLAALDLAIRQCEGRVGEYWTYAVAALHSFRLAAEVMTHAGPGRTAGQELPPPSAHNPVEGPARALAGVA